MKKIVLNSLVIFSLLFSVACLEKNTPASYNQNGGLTAAANVTPVINEVGKSRNIIVAKEDGKFSTITDMLNFIGQHEFYGDWLFFKDALIEGRISKAKCENGVNNCYSIYKMDSFHPGKELIITNPDNVADATDGANYKITCTLKLSAKSSDPTVPFEASAFVTAIQ